MKKLTHIDEKAISSEPEALRKIVNEVKACQVCASVLPHTPNPILQIGSKAKILIAGQAPGRVTHEIGRPFDDASGDRLRSWMGIDSSVFYDENKIAILPMAFCYPGKGKSGDLPPRPECAIRWRQQLLEYLPDVQLTLVIGQYAQRWYFQQKSQTTLTETVRNWQQYWPQYLVLPHPSPRNNIWLARNRWFENTVIPKLKDEIARVLMI